MSVSTSRAASAAARSAADVAAPIFRDFMAAALQGKPAIPFPAPPSGAPEVASAAPDAGVAAADNGDGAAANAPPAAADDGSGTTTYPGVPSAANVPPGWGWPPPWPSQPPPSGRDYATAQPRPAPPPWAPGYAVPPGYGGAEYRGPPRAYWPPGMPTYPPPGWAMRPGSGTGGLY